MNLEGWEKLIKPLREYCEQNNVAIHQIKEKFGGLRFYYGFAPVDNPPYADLFELAVEGAETRSLMTCEVCGKYGKLRSKDAEGQPMWMKTLCKEHALEHGYALDQYGT